MEPTNDEVVYVVVLARDSPQAENATVLVGNYPFPASIQRVRDLVAVVLEEAKAAFPGQKHVAFWTEVVVSRADPPPSMLEVGAVIDIESVLQPEEVTPGARIGSAHRGDDNEYNPYFVILTRAAVPAPHPSTSTRAMSSASSQAHTGNGTHLHIFVIVFHFLTVVAAMFGFLQK